MKFKFLMTQVLMWVILAGSSASAQSIPSSAGTVRCGDCLPNANWIKIKGTPDVSNRNNAAATGTSGGGNAWIGAPLPLPPNGHEYWITIRDLGNASTEEIIGTTITGLVVGKEYEIVLYSLTARANSYSPTYNDSFDFQLQGGSRITVNPTQNVWGINRLRFRATAPSRTISFYPGFNAATSSFQSVNISVTVNSINAVPTAGDDMAATDVNTPVSLGVTANDQDSDGTIVASTVDLDPTSPGIQKTVITSQGVWTVDALGTVTFSPALGFVGVAVLPYTVQDNYTLDGVSTPSTSSPATISVSVYPAVVCTEEVQGETFSAENGVPKVFSQPATNYGFVFDIFSLDNSFNMNINGTLLATSEIEFQSDSTPAPGINIRFADGDEYEADTPKIWEMAGSEAHPLIRVIISPTGGLSMMGSKVSGGPLYPLTLFNGNSFNSVTWNTNGSNEITVTQNVVGVTEISGRGYGLNVVPCACYNSPDTAGIPVDSQHGITLLQRAGGSSDWPMVRKGAHTVLESNTKGFVITRVATADLQGITTPVDGMMVYDTTEKCLKIYTVHADPAQTGWKCFNQPACP